MAALDAEPCQTRRYPEVPFDRGGCRTVTAVACYSTGKVEPFGLTSATLACRLCMHNANSSGTRGMVAQKNSMPIGIAGFFEGTGGTGSRRHAVVGCSCPGRDAGHGGAVLQHVARRHGRRRHQGRANRKRRPTRGAMGFELRGKDSLGFINMNRNKRSVRDQSEVRKPDAWRSIRWWKTADILVENYRPGGSRPAWHRLRLHCAKLNPGFDLCEHLGFRAASGAWSQRPGFDLIAQAMGGVISITGYPDQPPAKAGVPVADIGCALFSLYGILSASSSVKKAGARSNSIRRLALFDSAIAFAIWDICEFWGTGRVPRPLGTGNRMSAPYQAIRAKDDYFVFGANNDRLWRQLCELLDRLELLNDPRFRTKIIENSLANRDILAAELEKSFGEKTGRRMGGGPSCKGHTGWPDLSLRAGTRKRPRRTSRHGHGNRPPNRRPRPLDRVPDQAQRDGTDRSAATARLLGEHTDEILRELGFSAGDVEQMRAAGEVG